MTRNIYEQKLVDDLKINCIPGLTNKPNILKSNVNAKKNCDLKFEYTISGIKYTFCLEVKSDKSTNKSNNVLLIIGDILKNRLLEKPKGNTFGIFMDYDSTKGINSFFVDRIRKSYDSVDWNNFGKQNGCKYVFFYDSNVNECYYSKWKDFVKQSITPRFIKMI